MTQRWDTQKFPRGKRMEWSHCKMFNYLCLHDWHFVLCALSPLVSLREHHHDEKWRPRSSSVPCGKARRPQENNKDVVQSSKRTRQSQFVHPTGEKNRAKRWARSDTPRTIGMVRSTSREAFSTISTSSTPAWTQNWWSDDKWYEERWEEPQKWRSEWTVFPMHLEKVEYTVKVLAATSRVSNGQRWDVF